MMKFMQNRGSNLGYSIVKASTIKFHIFALDGKFLSI